jgi:RNA 3'-terminal phosphate cyclase (ATP)
VLTLDGSVGEGGGQILRTALSLSALTGQPFELTRLRAGRRQPGLLRQHLTAVQAVARVASAHVEGAALGSTRLVFEPGSVQPGVHHFSIGTAGSATLVLQAVLPALLVAVGPSRIVVEGGTHNPFAPPFDFLTQSFLSLVGCQGPRVVATLERWGFFPGGGGRITLEVEPCARLVPLELSAPPAVRARRVRAVVANLPRSVGERELQVVRADGAYGQALFSLEEHPGNPSRANLMMIELDVDTHCEVFTAFGARGLRAEAVATDALAQANAYLAAAQPVGVHLADQLLVPFAMAGAGLFRCAQPSPHMLTNLDVVRRFLDVPMSCRERAAGAYELRVGA